MLNESVHIAVPTAFYEDESINVPGTINHIKNLYKQGVKSVLVSGTTGEQHSLNLEEKFWLIHGLEQEKELLQQMEVIFGVASIRQKEAEELAERIRHTNITGVMIGYPPYIRPSQEEAVYYTASLLELSNKPAILYNNPGRTGFDLAVESIIKLSKYDEVIGIKDAGSAEKVERIKSSLHKNEFYFYAGGEMGLEEKVSGGYDRLSSIAGNVYPSEVAQWFHKLLEKQEVTKQESEQIKSIFNVVYHGNPILNVKRILNERGVSMGSCRTPIGNH